MDKNIVNETRNGNTRIIEYSDGSTLTRTYNQGVAGISDDNILEVLSYPNGTQEKMEYRTSGTGMLFGEAAGPYPYEIKKTHSDGSIEITSYKYNGPTGVGDQIATTKRYDKDGQLLGSEVITRQSTGYQKKYEDNRFGGYQDVNRESFDENGRLVEETTYDGKYTLGGDIKYDKGTTKSYTYDETGKVVSTKEYDKNGQLISNEIAKEISFGGKTYTFNANELKSIIGSLGNSKDEFAGALKSISSKCASIAGIVSSEDSGLSSTLNKTGDSCDLASRTLDNLIDSLSANIENFISKSVANEESVEQDIGAINNEIDDISNIFGSI